MKKKLKFFKNLFEKNFKSKNFFFLFILSFYFDVSKNYERK